MLNHDFQGFKVSEGKVRTLNRWNGKLNLSIVYSLSNIRSNNYWNRASTVKIIVGGWVVYFFETQCTSWKRYKIKRIVAIKVE